MNNYFYSCITKKIVVGLFYIFFSNSIMKKLTEREEEVMLALWKLEKAFIKDILPELPQKYHYNTVSTVVRLLETKGFVTHETYGNTHQYSPKISKQDYRSFYMKSASQRFFNNSFKNMLSF